MGLFSTRHHRCRLLHSWIAAPVVWFVFFAVCCCETVAGSADGTTMTIENNNNNININTDITVVMVTDVHSWIGGQHAHHEPQLNVHYGHLLSWYQHFKRQHHGHSPIFFVMNGDFVDGTGLSTVPPSHLTPLLQHMPWDAVNCGNHELYHNETVQHLVNSGFIDHWKGGYLTSNTLLLSTDDDDDPQTIRNFNNNKADNTLNDGIVLNHHYPRPLGNRYKILRHPESNTTLLTFGFLYNFQGNCPLTHVETVQDVIEQDWFRNVLQKAAAASSDTASCCDDAIDAILVLAHMDCVDDLVYVIHTAIRDIVGPDMPIQFVTGHSHRRAFAVLDETSTSIEAGRFLDTIGIMTFPKQKTIVKHRTQQQLKAKESVNLTALFRYTFLDANLDALTQSLGHEVSTGTYYDSDNLEGKTSNYNNNYNEDGPSWMTPEGRFLGQLIHETQMSLGLFDRVGCNPNPTYSLKAEIDDPVSLWKLYVEHVIPTQILEKVAVRNASSSSHGIRAVDTTAAAAAFIQSTMAFRYDLFQGEVSFDDVIAVCPFNDTIHRLVVDDGNGLIPGSDLIRALGPLSNKLVTTNNEDDSITTLFHGLMNSYGTLPPFVISTNTRPRSNEDDTGYIDPNLSYTLLLVDFDVWRIQARLEQVTNRTYSSQPFCPTTLSNTNDQHCLYTTNVWKDFVQQSWPCQESPSHSLSMARSSVHTSTSSVVHGVGAINSIQPAAVSTTLVPSLTSSSISQQQQPRKPSGREQRLNIVTNAPRLETLAEFCIIACICVLFALRHRLQSSKKGETERLEQFTSFQQNGDGDECQQEEEQQYGHIYHNYDHFANVDKNNNKNNNVKETTQEGESMKSATSSQADYGSLSLLS